MCAIECFIITGNLAWSWWIKQDLFWKKLVCNLPSPACGRSSIYNHYYNYSRVELQVLTTTDYATDGWLWTILTGALNHQIAHHLFPGVIQSHYRYITPIVRQVCKEFGIQYNYDESLFDAIKNHFIFLFSMGKKTQW